MAIVKGRNRDTAWFAMIDKEWNSIEKCFTQFLSESILMRMVNQIYL